MPLHTRSCTTLLCTSEDFEEIYANNALHTDVLSDDVLVNTIRETGKYYQHLVDASSQFRLDKLLEAMILHAPHSAGKRYVVIALHIAHGKGAKAVVDVANSGCNVYFYQVWQPSVISSVGDYSSEYHSDGYLYQFNLVAVRPQLLTTPRALHGRIRLASESGLALERITVVQSPAYSIRGESMSSLI